MSSTKSRADEIIERISANDPTLTRVGLCHEDIGDDGAKRVAKALRRNTHLTLINLTGNSIFPFGAKALAKVLTFNSHSRRRNTTLTRLSLDHNSIGDLGAKVISKALKSNSTLAMIDLSHNDICDVGAKFLAEALTVNSTLTELRLSINHISDIGAKDLAQALTNNSTLDALCLSRNDLTEVGGKLLVEMLYGNSTLTVLSFYSFYAPLSAEVRAKIIALVTINRSEEDSKEIRRQKIERRIGWMVEAEGGDGAQQEREAALVLMLDEIGNFPESARRRELLERVLGSPGGGADLAASLNTVPAGRALYRYAAECGAGPDVLMNVLRAHPSLCGTCRDVKNKLYPFMFLATLPEAGTGDVMELLLQCPSLVEGGISRPSGQGKRKRIDGA